METDLKPYAVYELLERALREIDQQPHGYAKDLIRKAQAMTGHRPEPVRYRG